MEKINDIRIILGGIVGGVVAFIVDSILNGVVFGKNWEAFIAQGLCKPATARTLLPEFALVLLISLIGTYTYALARPRLGAGAKSALRVASVVGFLVGIPSAVGMFIWSPMAPQMGWMLMVSGLVVSAVGTFVGAWVYKE